MAYGLARACESIGFILSLVAVILYVIAAATPAFIGEDPGHNSFGPFRACFPGSAFSDEDTQCVTINSDCILKVKAFGNIKGDIELSHCSHINAARALHIVATIIGTVALMMGLFAAVKIAKHVSFLVSMNLLAGIAGMISFALVVDYYRSYVDSRVNDLFLGYDLEYGTILLCIAWVLQLLAIPCYIVGAHEAGTGDHYTAFGA